MMHNKDYCLNFAARNLSDLIAVREKELHRMLQLTKESQRKNFAGKIRIQKRGEKTRYYLKTPETDSNGRYLKLEEEELAHRIIEGDYYQKVYLSSKKELQELERLRSFYRSSAIPENVINSLTEHRKKLITPVFISDEEYLRQWLEADYQRKAFKEPDSELYTENGERVRSKSEVLIANALKRFGVPYRYECRLELGTAIYHPDFTILDLFRRREVYWEHLGMMDDPDYSKHALDKLTRYEDNGIFPGDRLIITFETSSHPVSTRMIDSVIRHHLLP